jgi:hypothetical protein
MRPTAWPVAFLALLAFAALPPGPTARADEAPGLEQAAEALRRLDGFLNRVAAPLEETLEALRALAGSYFEIAPAEGEEHDATFERLVAAHRRAVRVRLFRALTVARPVRGENLREPVNVEAARLLGVIYADPRARSDARRFVSRGLIRALEGPLYKPRGYAISAELTETAYQALAAIGELSTLAWLADRHLHTREAPEDLAQILAAHRAMLRFREVPGELRHQIVRRMVAIYAGVETQASQSQVPGALAAQSARRFWDRTRLDLIATLQHLTGHPLNERGETLATMREFQIWWQHHGNPRRPPWTEPLAP